MRYLVASTLQMREVCEYPELKKITAQALTGSMTGEELWLIHDVEDVGRERGCVPTRVPNELRRARWVARSRPGPSSQQG